MSTTQLPPQAYTAEVIALAFEWLKAQPPQVHQMAKSADALVALYLKAKRNGFGIPEAQSTESFQKDLKSLSQKMRKFDGAFEAPPDVQSEIQDKVHAQVQEQLSNKTTLRQPPHEQPSTPPVVTAPRTPAAPEAPVKATLQLDPKSAEVVAKVQSHFNLSHPDEAVRMLIQLGYSKIRQIIE